MHPQSWDQERRWRPYVNRWRKPIPAFGVMFVGDSVSSTVVPVTGPYGTYANRWERDQHKTSSISMIGVNGTSPTIPDAEGRYTKEWPAIALVDTGGNVTGGYGVENGALLHPRLGSFALHCERTYVDASLFDAGDYDIFQAMGVVGKTNDPRRVLARIAPYRREVPNAGETLLATDQTILGGQCATLSDAVIQYESWQPFFRETDDRETKPKFQSVSGGGHELLMPTSGVYYISVSGLVKPLSPGDTGSQLNLMLVRTMPFGTPSVIDTTVLATSFGGSEFKKWRTIAITVTASLCDGWGIRLKNAAGTSVTVRNLSIHIGFHRPRTNISSRAGALIPWHEAHEARYATQGEIGNEGEV